MCSRAQGVLGLTPPTAPPWGWDVGVGAVEDDDWCTAAAAFRLAITCLGTSLIHRQSGKVNLKTSFSFLSPSFPPLHSVFFCLIFIGFSSSSFLMASFSAATSAHPRQCRYSVLCVVPYACCSAAVLCGTEAIEKEDFARATFCWMVATRMGAVGGRRAAHTVWDVAVDGGWRDTSAGAVRRGLTYLCAQEKKERKKEGYNSFVSASILNEFICS